jgi:hypothetical protein
LEETLAYRLRDVLPDKAEFVAVDTPAPERTWGRSQSLAIFAGFLFIALALQVWMGAFSVERGFYSDDAAHFLNGLVIRDYLYHAIGTDPLKFAEQYYLTYPKIAPLMWPPLFHVTLGLFLLPGWPAAPAALLLVGLCSTWVAWRLQSMVRELAGPAAGVVAAGLFLTTPLVMQISSVVMLDVVIAAFSLEAAYWLAQFVRSTSSRDAGLYGVFTALACLTKGNGVALVLMPILIVLITGRFNLLRRAGLYVAAAIVLVFATPLLAISARFDAGIGDFAPVTAVDVAQRMSYYGGHLWTNVGAVSLGFAVLGACVVLARARQRPDAAVPLAEALLALAASAMLFHLLNPHKVAVGRYLTMAIGPIIGLAIVGAAAVAQGVRSEPSRRLRLAATLALVIVAALVVRPAPAPRRPLGYRRVVSRLATANQLAGRRLLVVSDEIGEGAAVTEAATLNLPVAPTIVRGSKLLASDNWMGAHFQLTYGSSSALMKDLEDLHIDYILLDRSEQPARLPYFEQVRELTDTSRGRLELIEAPAPNPATGPTRPLELYRVKTQSPGPPKSLQISLRHTLGRTLQ